MASVSSWSEFITTFSFNIVVALALFGLFCALYRTEWFKRLHASRMYGKEEGIPIKPMKSPLAWVMPVWNATEEEIVRDAGLDAAVFLRMFYFSIQILFLLNVICLPILLPLHSSGNRKTDSTVITIDSLSSSNLPNGSALLWANFTLLWVMSILLFALMWISYHHMWELRHSFLAARARKQHPEEYTLLLTDVPDSDIDPAVPLASTSVAESIRSASQDLLLARSESEAGGPTLRRAFLLLRTASLGIIRGPVHVQKDSAMRHKQRQVDNFFLNLYEKDYLCHQGVIAFGKSLRLYKAWKHAVTELRRAVWAHNEKQEQEARRQHKSLQPEPYEKKKLQAIFDELVHIGEGRQVPVQPAPAMASPPEKGQEIQLAEHNIGYASGQDSETGSTGKFPGTIRSGSDASVAKHHAEGSSAATPAPSSLDSRSPSRPVDAEHEPVQLSQRPVHWWWWWGPHVSSIPFWLKQVKEREAELKRAQKKDRLRRVTNSSFVSFSTRRVSSVAAQTVHSIKGNKWLLKQAPQPGDVVWSNVGLRLWERTLRYHLGILLTVGLVVFFYLPVTLIAGLTSLNNLIKVFPFLARYLNEDWFSGFLESFLPSLSLRVMLWIVPPFALLIAHLQGCSSHSQAVRMAASKHFYVLLCNVFLGYTFTGTLLAQLQAIIQHPGDLLTILGTSIPRTSSFFISYTLISSVLFLLELLRFPIPLIKLLYRTLTVGRQVADRERLWEESSIAYEVFVPYQNLVLTFGFVFAVITPLMLPFTLLYSVIGYFVWKHQILYVYSARYQTGGLLWPHFVNHVFVALVLAQLTSMGEFALKEGFYQAAWTLPLLFATSYGWLMLNSQFRSSFRVLPLELACAVDVDNSRQGVAPRAEDLKHEYTPECLRHIGDDTEYDRLLAAASSIAQAAGELAPEPSAVSPDAVDSEEEGWGDELLADRDGWSEGGATPASTQASGVLTPSPALASMRSSNGEVGSSKGAASR